MAYELRLDGRWSDDIAALRNAITEDTNLIRFDNTLGLSNRARRPTARGHSATSPTSRSLMAIALTDTLNIDAKLTKRRPSNASARATAEAN